PAAPTKIAACSYATPISYTNLNDPCRACCAAPIPSRYPSPKFSTIRQTGLPNAEIYTALTWQHMRSEFGPAQVKTNEKKIPNSKPSNTPWAVLARQTSSTPCQKPGTGRIIVILRPGTGFAYSEVAN